MQVFVQPKQHKNGHAMANYLSGKHHNSQNTGQGTLQAMANNSLQVKKHTLLQAMANQRPVVQLMVPKGLQRGTRVKLNIPEGPGRKAVILSETSQGYLVRLTPGPRMRLMYAHLDLDQDIPQIMNTPGNTGPGIHMPSPFSLLPPMPHGLQNPGLIPPLSGISMGSQTTEMDLVREKIGITTDHPKESGEHFRWPEALWENVIKTLPTTVMINSAKTSYKYSLKGGVSIQPPGGREMKKQEDLIKRGAWKSEETRGNYLLTVEGGILKDVKGMPLHGSIQYVLSDDWKLYGQEVNALNEEKTKFGRSSDVHTRYLAGGPARSAGWIKTDGGKITRVGNDSGHYGPNKYMLYQLLTLLKDGGTDLSSVSFHDEEISKASNALEMYNWMKSGAMGAKPKNVDSKGM